MANKFVEYFGLTGNVEYDKKSKQKIELCRQLQIELIAIYPRDLMSSKKLEQKLSAILSN